jgi:hypothetical protein
VDVRCLRAEAGIIQILHCTNSKTHTLYTQHACDSLSDITAWIHVVTVRHDPSAFWAGVQSLGQGHKRSEGRDCGARVTSNAFIRESIGQENKTHCLSPLATGGVWSCTGLAMVRAECQLACVSTKIVTNCKDCPTSSNSKYRPSPSQTRQRLELSLATIACYASINSGHSCCGPHQHLVCSKATLCMFLCDLNCSQTLN